MRSTPCAAAAQDTQDDLQAAGVDVSILVAMLLAAVAVVAVRLGRERIRAILVRFAKAIDRQFIAPLDAPGPDRWVDPLVSGGMTKAAEALADYLYDEARQ